MDWGLSDYVIAGVLVSLLVGGCVFAVQKAKTPTQRVVFCAAIVVLFVLIWAEFAVGLFGTPFAGD